MANFIDVLDTQYSGPFSCTILAGALLEFFRFAIYNSVHDEHFAKHSYIPVVSTYWSLSVSKNRLVDTYISILRCLFDNPINVNKIIEQTSPDRTYVIKAIKHLERAQLLVEQKDANHKQKKIKKLTSLGDELVQLMFSIKRYSESYHELRKRIMDNIIIEQSDGSILRSKLRARGWAEEDLNRYHFYVIDSYWFLFESYTNMISALTIRKANILYEYSPKETVKLILNKIISDAISHLLSVMMEYIEGTEITNKRLMYRPLVSDFSNTLRESLIYSNKFIEKEVKDVLLSIFSVLSPPTQYIEEELKRLQLKLKIAEGNEQGYKSRKEMELAHKLKAIEEEEHKKDNMVNMKKLKDAIELYKEILEKST